MKKVINKIVVVCLDEPYASKLATCVAESLGMIFCSSKDLVEYELIDKSALKTFATKEYLQESERKVFQHISTFNNVVVSVDYDMFSGNKQELSKNSLVVFAKLEKEEISNKISAIAYNRRSAELQSAADLTIDVSKKQKIELVCEQTIKKLGGLI